MVVDNVAPGRAKPFPRQRLLKARRRDPGARVLAQPTAPPPSPPRHLRLSLTVNGATEQLEVPITETLAETLRERLGLTGTKIGCDDGSCGTCTVLLGGQPIYACMALTARCAAQAVETIEGVGNEQNPHVLQKTYAESYAAQCGFCIPGMIMAAKALLDANPAPSEDEVRLALSGVICRCGYRNIIHATLQAGEALRRADR